MDSVEISVDGLLLTCNKNASYDEARVTLSPRLEKAGGGSIQKFSVQMKFGQGIVAVWTKSEELVWSANGGHLDWKDRRLGGPACLVDHVNCYEARPDVSFLMFPPDDTTKFYLRQTI